MFLMVHLMGLGSAFILSCKAFKDLKRYMLCTSCAHNIKCVILCTISKWIYIPLGESVQLCIAAAQHVFFQNPFKGALRKPLLGFFLAGNLCWFMLFQMHKHRCMGCVTVTNTSFFFFLRLVARLLQWTTIQEVGIGLLQVFLLRSFSQPFIDTIFNYWIPYTF